MYDTYDCDITIYNAQYDRKVGDRVWRRMQISGVSFYGGQQVTVSDSGLSTADEYTVRIPLGSMPDGFVDPAQYAKLPDPAGHWTAAAGDIVVKGLVDDEITKPADITGKYDACFTVTGLYDNRRGLPAMRHIRIKGK